MENSVFVENVLKQAYEDVKNGLRFGQAIWNRAAGWSYGTRRDEILKLTGSKYDPFYDDSKAQAFLEALEEIIEKEEL